MEFKEIMDETYTDEEKLTKIQILRDQTSKPDAKTADLVMEKIAKLLLDAGVSDWVFTFDAKDSVKRGLVGDKFWIRGIVEDLCEDVKNGNVNKSNSAFDVPGALREILGGRHDSPKD